ncbi:MAG TPA: hypothetical protein VHV08_12230, partial [Pirellulales bacterium]|nr:hypothetical protein [Pirellulales bacterium]
MHRTQLEPGPRQSTGHNHPLALSDYVDPPRPGVHECPSSPVFPLARILELPQFHGLKRQLRLAGFELRPRGLGNRLADNETLKIAGLPPIGNLSWRRAWRFCRNL